MQEFDFIEPDNVEELCSLLAREDRARVIAGGTDLMLELRQNKLPAIGLIIDISNLSELDYIREDGDLIRLGSGTTQARIKDSELINRHSPLLARAAGSIGSAQIRNRGTIGGNIATASPAADTIPPLVALEAGVVIKRDRDMREIPLAELLTGPYQTGLEQDEIIVEINFKKPAENIKSSFHKITRRKAVDKARINIALIAGQNRDGRIEDLRIVPGSVTPIVRRFRKAEEILQNRLPTGELLERSANRVAEEMVAITGYRWSTDYKKPVIRNLTLRALREVLEL